MFGFNFLCVYVKNVQLTLADTNPQVSDTLCVVILSHVVSLYSPKNSEHCKE